MKVQGSGYNYRKIPWMPFAAEMAGTALLVFVGLSVVIFNFGEGTPVARILPDAGARRLVTGFLFGITGALIAVSPLGRESGAHINPAVTLAFWMKGKIGSTHAICYVISQMVGAAVGAIPLLAWGRMGESVAFGTTIPGKEYGPWWALAGETATTFMLITGLFVFLGHKTLRRFTPGLFPFLYAIMVFLEAPVSGTSTNPARTFGPAVVAWIWNGWWIYWAGPFLGTLMGVGVFRLPALKRLEVEVAKLYHFEHDRYSIFHR